jgi:hypothetical protein
MSSKGTVPLRFVNNNFLRIYYLSTHYTRSRDSSVGIATRYAQDDRGVGVRVPVGSRILSTSFNRLWGHPASYPMRTGGSFPGVKRPRREADHSPAASAEVKKIWIYTTTPSYASMAQCLIS